MWFLRLAGCSVGKRMTGEQRAFFLSAERLASNGRVEAIATYREVCTLWSGTQFCCDTDFISKEVLTVPEILSKIPSGVRHICLTGGEPLDHELTPLLNSLEDYGHFIHIETSGTVSITERAYPAYLTGDSMEVNGGWLWITVSPKHGVLPEMLTIANEIKLLVDENFDIATVPKEVLGHDLVFLQPINFELDVNKKNVDLCLALQKEHPNWRISSQAHKLWNVR